jgi:putative heme-binding domain-containing protein
VLVSVLKESGEKGPPRAVVAQLMRIAAALKNEEAQLLLQKAAMTPKDNKFANWQFEVVSQHIARIRVTDWPVVGDWTRIHDAALDVVADSRVDESDRIAALGLVGKGWLMPEKEKSILLDLLSSKSSPTIRSAAINHIGRLAAKWASDLLLQGWKSYVPSTRSQVLDALLSQKDGPSTILSAIEAKSISPSEVDATRRQRLLTHSDKAIRERAAKVFDGAIDSDRAKVVKEYADSLSAHGVSGPLSGDAVKGKAVFTKVCAACHKLGEVGVQVGPDLAMITNRTPAFLLQEILDPNRNLDSRYVEYQAITKGMRNVTGMLVNETATSITLRGQQQKDETLLRTDIEELRGSGKSLMPEGLEKDLPKKDIADLIAFITHVRPAPKAIAGNTPALIKPVGGRLTLRAPQSEIYGGDITLEPDFWNIGMWHGANDRVEWRIELPARTTYDIFIDYACDAGSAGNELIVEGIEPIGKWKVPSTGAWSKYQTVRVAIGHVAAGESRIVIRPADKIKGALIDLRTVYLVPPGTTPKDEKDGKDRKEGKEPTDAAAVAKLILDDSQPAERRNKLIADNKHQSAELIAAMASDIKDSKEEYRRIPWIWRVAIAAGKRNDEKEIRAILDVSLPKETLTDWQAVVIGGGIINGISQLNKWPGERLSEILAEDRVLNRAWNNAIKQSFTMADNKKVPMGTRYDALRILALADRDAAIAGLSKYIGKGVNAELQMGAVSGLVDVHAPKSGDVLLKCLPDLTKENRNLAIDGLMRTPGRTKGLLNGLKNGDVKVEWLSESQRKALREHKDEDVRRIAGEVLK